MTAQAQGALTVEWGVEPVPTARRPPAGGPPPSLTVSFLLYAALVRRR